jgi:ParB family chromosome partitioning protein
LDRSTIANSLRLLNLPKVAQDAILKGELTAGHGRALLSGSDATLVEKTTRRAIREGWSVRRLEQEVSGNGKVRGRPIKTLKTSRWSTLEDALKRKYGTAVKISHRFGKGKVTFEYYSEEDLTRLIDLLGVRLD